MSASVPFETHQRIQFRLKALLIGVGPDIARRAFFPRAPHLKTVPNAENATPRT